MRIPTRPPPFTPSPPSPLEPEAWAQAGAWMREGLWLTWDEVRHRSRAAKRKPESVWWATQIYRESHLQPLDLDDDRGRPFRLASGLVSLQQPLREIDLALRGDAAVGPVVTPADRDRIVNRSLSEEAFRSSEIEGAVTTRKRARTLLASGDRPRNRSEQMIVNNYRAMQYVRERRREDITVAHLLALQAILVDGTLEDAEDGGRLRREEDDVRVVDAADGAVLHVPPPAAALPERRDRMLAFANATVEPGAQAHGAPWLHPALRAIATHFLLAWEHPFVDGNGRCARALWYWVMLRNGYWMTEFISISEAIGARRGEYYQAFKDTELDHNDLTYFVMMHLKVVTDALARLRARLERHRERLHGVQRDLGVLPMNHRQKTLIAHALRHPGERYRFDTHARHHGVAYGTARSDLTDLAARGLLPETREGRTRVFLAPQDLADRIARLGSAGG